MLNRSREHCNSVLLCSLIEVSACVHHNFPPCITHTEVIAIKGLNNVTVDSLVQDVTPKARGIHSHGILMKGGYAHAQELNLENVTKNGHLIVFYAVSSISK